MHCEKVELQELYLIRLNPGDDIQESLKEAAERLGMANGIILGGVGSTSSYHYHVVSTGVNPPEEIYPKGKAPADILSVSGMILNGKVHAHVSFSNDRVAYGGHLEPGTTVLTFSTILIAKIGNDIEGWDRIDSIEHILAQRKL